MQTAAFPPSANARAILNGLSSAIRGTANTSTDLGIKTAIDIASRSGLWLWMLQSVAASADKQKANRLCNDFGRLADVAFQEQKKSWIHAQQALNSRGINSALFKGLLYSTFLRPHGEVIFNDVDLIVNLDDIADVKSCLMASGFSQNIVSHENAIQIIPDTAILDFERTHYELFPFTKIVRAEAADNLVESITDLGLTHPFLVDAGKAFVAIELDVHHNFSRGIDPTEWLTATTQRWIYSQPTQVLNWETHVWFVSARLYHEIMILGSKKLRPLVELSQIIKSIELDWAKIIAVSKKYALSPGIFYVLSFLDDVFQVPIPRVVLDTLRADGLENGRFHDLGDFVPKALGETVLIRPMTPGFDGIKVPK